MTIKLTADVIVVGSGAGGSAVAGEVAAAGHRVLVLDAGSRMPHWPRGHARSIDPSEAGLVRYRQETETHLVWPSNRPDSVPGLSGFKVAHVLGGMFALWTCNCPSPHELELPPWDDPTQWRHYLAKARQRLHVTEGIGRDGLRMRRLLAATKRAVGELPVDRDVQPMPLAARMESGRLIFSSADDLMGDTVIGSGRLDVRTDTICRRILTRGARATSVQAVDRQTGEAIDAHADAVVVACGTVGTPVLLAASGLDCGPALGAGIFDHSAFASRVRLKCEIIADVPDDDPIFTVWVPFSEAHRWHNQLCLFPGLPAPLSIETGARDTADIFTWVPMDVDLDNRLSFHHEQLDPFGLPGVTAVFRHSEGTRARSALALAEHFRIASAIGEIGDGWYPAFYKPGESTHLMGGCRMGPKDDGTSVVDATGRLWRYDNLYAAGNSVHSHPSAGNPTLMTVAAGLRTADVVCGRRPV